MSEHRRIGKAAAVLSALVLTGCSSGPQPYMGSATRGQMIAHFDLALELRGHAVRGDLTRFRATAERLADLDPARDLPPDVILQLGPMRWEARSAAAARTNEAAAWASAEVARTCGDCHLANDVRLGDRFVVGSPPSGDTPEQHMAGLAHVSRLLWDGLVGPSDRTWIAGAEALVAAGSLPEGIVGRVPARDVDFASERLQRLGREAAAADQPAYRVQALAEIWSTCSDCHTKAGLDPHAP